MKAASAATKALLATGNARLADVYTFTLVDGTIVRYTSLDQDVMANGFLFSSKGPLITRGTVKAQRGLAVDSLAVTFAAKPTITLGGMPLLWLLEAGAFDGATCLVETAVMPTWGDTTGGTVIRFLGRVSDIAGDRGSATIMVRAMTQLLDIMMPRNLYQAACGNTLFDATCGLTEAAFSFSAAALSGSTRSLIKTSLAQADSYYTLGRIKGLAGVNAGAYRTIKAHAAGNISAALPFLYTPIIGDTFTASAGCPKTRAICESRFSNLLRFRGQPYIPVAETAF